MNSFDTRAQSWDENPMHLKRSEAIAGKMKSNMLLHNQMTALEYGAGTGILSFLLKDDLKSITMMDSSRAMVAEMTKKIERTGATNLIPLYFNLETSFYNKKTYDLVFMQMVLHHVAKHEDVLSTFYTLLNPGGQIAIADLYPEDGSFHAAGFDGHLGFDVDELAKTLVAIGFTNIRHELCFVVKKTTEADEVKEFPVFIMMAER